LHELSLHIPWQESPHCTFNGWHFASTTESISLKQPCHRHRSCPRLGDARVSAQRTIAREPYRIVLTPR
jgi:hypothetical protein